MRYVTSPEMTYPPAVPKKPPPAKGLERPAALASAGARPRLRRRRVEHLYGFERLVLKALVFAVRDGSAPAALALAAAAHCRGRRRRVDGGCAAELADRAKRLLAQAV
eukprot:CAMPEP_0175363336 /NCGR_PEP_ID=MMETSP0095-20121207/17536_1 /TAXON_ID=311494 /ORGANISM="Alexandrium monilatum, Strain CCMP3105" /LENGTH=107 /DNA_ID=CAMNT_0016661243 /DNA_START=190 /DNA_END=511 /DNA_ORIENTATION=+